MLVVLQWLDGWLFSAFGDGAASGTMVTYRLERGVGEQHCAGEAQATGFGGGLCCVLASQAVACMEFSAPWAHYEFQIQ